MSRKVILEILLVIIAGIIVGIIALMYWLIMLIPYLIHPRWVRPMADKLESEFGKQMANMFKRRHV